MLGYNPAMFRRSSLILGLFVLLTACVSVTSTPSPIRASMTNTASPSQLPRPDPTISSPTPQLASPTQTEVSPTFEDVTEAAPTETPVPLPTLDLTTTLDMTPTLTVTAIPQPAADSAAIQFLSPGPLSKLVSPFDIFGFAVPGYLHKSTLDLYGEDGSLLASQLLQLNTPYKWANYYYQMSFKLNSVGELGRLTLSTQDQYGRINAVNSVHLLLFSEGMSILNPPGDLKERCSIGLPVPGQRISGGVLTVAGKIRPFNSLPLTLELIGRDGNIIGTQAVPISPAPDDSYVPFRVDMQYRTSQSMWALLSVRQNDDRIGGIMYLYSQEIFLYP